MEKAARAWTLGELAELLGGSVEGPADVVIERPAPAGSNDPTGLTFAESQQNLNAVEGSDVGAVILGSDTGSSSKPAIRVPNARKAFAEFLGLARREMPLAPGIHPSAVVSPEAKIAPSASVGPFAVVEQGAEVEDGARVFPFCYVGQGCHVGANSTLYPHVVLYQDVRVGAGSVIHSGAVIGADGFGYAWDGARHVKVPQVGGVRLGDNVEVGALTAIDRSTAGDTVIGSGSKIDNLVQIAHNCSVGENSVIASQTGLSGSTRIGSRVTIAGQCATSDHTSVADDIVLAGRTGVMGDLTEPGTYFGAPARPYGDVIRSMALTLKLPEIYSRIKDLEKKVRGLAKE